MRETNPKAIQKLSYGLFVCTALREGKHNGCIINTAIQIASGPDRISVAVRKPNLTHDMIKETGALNISVLSQKATFDLIKNFGLQSGRDVDKFENLPADAFDAAENGIRYITAGTNAYFSLKVEQEVELASHTLFICEPTFMTVLSDEPSCTYEYYRQNSQPKG